VKVGDLVKLPPSSTYWWGGKVGIIDLIVNTGLHGATWLEYRVLVPPNRYARFNDTSFVEVISESR